MAPHAALAGPSRLPQGSGAASMLMAVSALAHTPTQSVSDALLGQVQLAAVEEHVRRRSSVDADTLGQMNASRPSMQGASPLPYSASSAGATVRQLNADMAGLLHDAAQIGIAQLSSPLINGASTTTETAQQHVGLSVLTNLHAEPYRPRIDDERLPVASSSVDAPGLPNTTDLTSYRFAAPPPSSPTTKTAPHAPQLSPRSEARVRVGNIAANVAAHEYVAQSFPALSFDPLDTLNRMNRQYDPNQPFQGVPSTPSKLYVKLTLQCSI
jgi:hypothetical protein